MPTKRSGKSGLRQLTSKPVSSEECRNAALVLKHAHDSASALLKAFNLAKSQRGGKVVRGMTTDPEQDLLRAMLVMAAAGLDAMAKQLIEDSLPALVQIDPAVKKGLETFIARRIKGDGESTRGLSGGKFVARILAAPSHQAQVIREYIEELTGGSLQSVGELRRTAEALGVRITATDDRTLQPIFNIRNTIIHELDMNLQGDRRKRNLRKEGDMIRHTNVLLEVAENMRDAVDRKLAESGRLATGPFFWYPEGFLGGTYSPSWGPVNVGEVRITPLYRNVP